MITVQAITDAGARQQFLRNSATVQVDVGNRLLAKLALAVGYQLLGKPFLETEYSKTLRAAFREADYEKQKKSLVRDQAIYQARWVSPWNNCCDFRGRGFC